MDKRHALEVRVRRALTEDLKQANARLKEVADEIDCRELRLEVESDLMSHQEREALERSIPELRAEQSANEALVETLPERIKLYRPLGRPEPTVLLHR